MGMTRSIQILVGSACVLLAETYTPVHAVAADQLAELSGKASAFVTLRSRDNFSTATMSRSAIIPRITLWPIR